MTDNNKIITNVLPGFMELLPKDQIEFNRIKNTIEKTYEQFGFIPLDTPVIERAEVLFASSGGETEKQIYRFTKGDNDLALRFDLTVPLARYVSEHFHDLVFPFRRYHIAKVYRGESPQRGRFREFYQCDIDIIGDTTLSIINDAEIPSIIYTLFSKLDFGKFVIKINNRKIFNGLLESVDAKSQSVQILRIVDKLDKIGHDAVKDMLVENNISSEAVEMVFKFLKISGTPEEILSSLKTLGVHNETFNNGLSELSQVVAYMTLLGVPKEYYNIDLSIARGLDYYTGTVYETQLVDHPEVGSICSGGRYDNLAEQYSDKKLPGVGISIGLTRLFSQLKELGIIKSDIGTLTKALIVPLSEDLSAALLIANSLRQNNIQTEVYMENEKIKQKLKYADKLGVPYVILVGEDEIASKLYTVKNMKTGVESKVAIEKIAKVIEDNA